MKHSIPVIAVLLTMFLLAQFIGLFVLYKNIDFVKSSETGKTEFKDLPVGERPPLEEKTSFVSLLIAVLIGTALLLLLIKYKLLIIWKIWFLLAVVFALTIVLGTFVRLEIAVIAALIAGVWKLFRPNLWIHNLTELFLYGGLAVVLVPLFNLFSAVILLLVISGYDAYAVWKSKHMITMAKSQAKAKMFAGLLIPYNIKGIGAKGPGAGKKQLPAETAKGIGKTKVRKVRTAVLGGGDIGFPLIFAGVLLKELGLWQSLVVPFGAALGLCFLLWNGKKDRFYPAMPFISAGCFVALGVVLVLGLVV